MARLRHLFFIKRGALPIVPRLAECHRHAPRSVASQQSSTESCVQVCLHRNKSGDPRLSNSAAKSESSSASWCPGGDEVITADESRGFELGTHRNTTRESHGIHGRCFAHHSFADVLQRCFLLQVPECVSTVVRIVKCRCSTMPNRE